MPTLTVIAGPNGSGKSTLSQRLRFEGKELLVDPDAVARELNPGNPVAVAIAAGRESLRRIDSYLTGRQSFATETTLSGAGPLALIRQAKSLGYEIHLVFIALNRPERCISRIRNRVQRGGHFVPDADVMRRYERSIANSTVALRIADRVRFYDNSGSQARLVLIARNGAIVWQADPLPAWVRI